MAELLNDTIDFSAYLEETDAEHRVIKASSYVDDVVEYYHSETPVRGDVMPWEKTHAEMRFRL